MFIMRQSADTFIIVNAFKGVQTVIQNLPTFQNSKDFSETAEFKLEPPATTVTLQFFIIKSSAVHSLHQPDQAEHLPQDHQMSPHTHMRYMS